MSNSIFSKMFSKKKTVKDEITELTTELQELKELNKLRELKKTKDEIVANDDNEGFVKIKGILEEADGRIRLELDWNQAFVEHLKSNGYNGSDDNAIIQRYIAELTAMVTNEMKGDDNDYE